MGIKFLICVFLHVWNKKKKFCIGYEIIKPLHIPENTHCCSKQQGASCSSVCLFFCITDASQTVAWDYIIVYRLVCAVLTFSTSMSPVCLFSVSFYVHTCMTCWLRTCLLHMRGNVACFLWRCHTGVTQAVFYCEWQPDCPSILLSHFSYM